MTKVWDGPTPPITSGSIGPLMDAGFDMGFRACMNSPLVRAMYEALRDTRIWDTTGQSATMKALSGYEAGLKEMP